MPAHHCSPGVPNKYCLCPAENNDILRDPAPALPQLASRSQRYLAVGYSPAHGYVLPGQSSVWQAGAYECHLPASLLTRPVRTVHTPIRFYLSAATPECQIWLVLEAKPERFAPEP